MIKDIGIKLKHTFEITLKQISATASVWNAPKNIIRIWTFTKMEIVRKKELMERGVACPHFVDHLNS